MTWWDDAALRPNPLPECPHCGEATVRDAWEANGGQCSGCRPIVCDDPGLAGRLWLVEWGETVRRIHAERAALEAARLHRRAQAANERNARAR